LEGADGTKTPREKWFAPDEGILPAPLPQERLDEMRHASDERKEQMRAHMRNKDKKYFFQACESKIVADVKQLRRCDGCARLMGCLNSLKVLNAECERTYLGWYTGLIKPKLFTRRRAASRLRLAPQPSVIPVAGRHMCCDISKSTL
jgi:hypothetical protein